MLLSARVAEIQLYFSVRKHSIICDIDVPLTWGLYTWIFELRLKFLKGVHHTATKGTELLRLGFLCGFSFRVFCDLRVLVHEMPFSIAET